MFYHYQRILATPLAYKGRERLDQARRVAGEGGPRGDDHVGVSVERNAHVSHAFPGIAGDEGAQR